MKKGRLSEDGYLLDSLPFLFKMRIRYLWGVIFA